MAPAAFRRHRKRGGHAPPSSSSSSLTFSLDGRRVSPLVLGLHGMGGARAPPRLDLSLCLSLFLRSLILAFHRFLYSRRSVTPIGLKFGHDFYPDIGFLAAKEGHQPPYGVATRVRGTPPYLVAPRASSRIDSSSQNSHIFHTKISASYSIFECFIHIKLNRKLGKIHYYNKGNHYFRYYSKPIHILLLHYT